MAVLKLNEFCNKIVSEIREEQRRGHSWRVCVDVYYDPEREPSAGIISPGSSSLDAYNGESVAFYLPSRSKATKKSALRDLLEAIEFRLAHTYDLREKKMLERFIDRLEPELLEE